MTQGGLEFVSLDRPRGLWRELPMGNDAGRHPTSSWRERFRGLWRELPMGNDAGRHPPTSSWRERFRGLWWELPMGNDAGRPPRRRGARRSGPSPSSVPIVGPLIVPHRRSASPFPVAGPHRPSLSPFRIVVPHRRSRSPTRRHRSPHRCLHRHRFDHVAPRPAAAAAPRLPSRSIGPRRAAGALAPSVTHPGPLALPWAGRRGDQPRRSGRARGVTSASRGSEICTRAPALNGGVRAHAPAPARSARCTRASEARRPPRPAGRERTPHSPLPTPHSPLATRHSSRPTPHASRLTPHASRPTPHSSRPDAAAPSPRRARARAASTSRAPFRSPPDRTRSHDRATCGRSAGRA